MPNGDLVEGIRAVLSDSTFHGEGHLKIWVRMRLLGVRPSLAQGTTPDARV